jgi:hypothetical protein
MKRCGTCGLTKPLEEFHYKNRAAGTRQSTCTACARAYQRTWYADHRERHGQTSKVRRDEWRASLVRVIERAKAVPCADCGERYPSYVMDFDHLHGDKLANVSSLKTASLERLLGEMHKCDVVCANCHRLRTVARRSEARA